MTSASTTRADADRLALAFLADKGSQVTHPDECRETCVERSREFADLLTEHGLDATTVDGAEFGEVPFFPGHRVMLNGHTATLVRVADAEWVYDFTARQFDPAAPVPLVLSLKTWRQRWADLRDPVAVRGDGAEVPHT